jgi:SAM-dependent methyltransferase
LSERTLNAWGKYPIWSRDLVETARCEFGTDICVLKTDANNEAFGNVLKPDFHIRPIIPLISDLCRVSCIDIDEAVVEKAKETFPFIDIRTGDVRSLPYGNASFHVLIDLSTIDHVWEYQQALDEYVRVLIPNGLLLLVVWLDSHEHAANCQCWFKDKEFIGALNDRFRIISMVSYDHVHGKPTEGRLVKFICKKVGG